MLMRESCPRQASAKLEEAEHEAVEAAKKLCRSQQVPSQFVCQQYVYKE